MIQPISVQILLFFFALSIVLYIFTFILTVFFVTPLQFKESMVKDGLLKLRKQLLYKDILFLVVAITSVCALTARFFIDGESYRYIISILIIMNAIGSFGQALIDFRIYRQIYDES